MRILTLGFIVASLVSGCGSEREIVQQAPSGNQAPAAPQDLDPESEGKPALNFSEVSAIMKISCARCHSSARFISNEAAFLSSQAQSRASSLNMPPPSSQEARGLSAADRQKIVLFN